MKKQEKTEEKFEEEEENEDDNEEEEEKSELEQETEISNLIGEEEFLESERGFSSRRVAPILESKEIPIANLEQTTENDFVTSKTDNQDNISYGNSNNFSEYERQTSKYETERNMQRAFDLRNIGLERQQTEIRSSMQDIQFMTGQNVNNNFSQRESIETFQQIQEQYKQELQETIQQKRGKQRKTSIR